MQVIVTHACCHQPSSASPSHIAFNSFPSPTWREQSGRQQKLIKNKNLGDDDWKFVTINAAMTKCKIDAQSDAGIIETMKRLQKQAWRWRLLTPSKFSIGRWCDPPAAQWQRPSLHNSLIGTSVLFYNRNTPKKPNGLVLLTCVTHP